MASSWDALYLALLYVGGPGFGIVSVYSIWQAIGFYRRLRASAPGLLVLLTIIGWITTLAGAAFIMTWFLGQAPESAGPAVLPMFIIWAGSLITIAWVVYRWGIESQVLDSYYGEIERMERMKSGFINHVAHELNTPMTPLRMQVSVLLKQSLGPLTDKQVVALQRIDRNVERLGTLVDQVLMASALQSGRLRVTPVRTDLHRLLAKVAQAVPGVVLAPSGPIEAEVDAERLGYAAQTLALHLIGASEGQPVGIQACDEGTAITIRFTHSGPSLAQRDFEMFGEPVIIAGRDGLAIGLYNVHGIVGRHGGKVEVAPGGVVIRIPVQQAVLVQSPRLRA